MRTTLIISITFLFYGCSFFHPRIPPISKYNPRAEYWESNYTGIGHDDHPAMIKKRLEHMDKLRNGCYYHSNRGNPWVYNTYTKEYEAWSWDMVRIGKNNGTVINSSIGLDYTPPDADERRYINDLDRKRFRDKGDPQWWIRKYGRVPKVMTQRQYNPQVGY